MISSCLLAPCIVRNEGFVLSHRVKSVLLQAWQLKQTDLKQSSHYFVFQCLCESYVQLSKIRLTLVRHWGGSIRGVAEFEKHPFAFSSHA